MGIKDIIRPSIAPKGLIEEIKEINKLHLEGLQKIEAKFTTRRGFVTRNCKNRVSSIKGSRFTRSSANEIL